MGAVLLYPVALRLNTSFKKTCLFKAHISIHISIKEFFY